MRMRSRGPLFFNWRRFHDLFSRKTFIEKSIFIFSALIGIGLSGLLFLFLLVRTEILGDLPDNDELRDIENPIASEVYSVDSVLLGRYYIQERSDVEFKKVPVPVINALLATEDIRFYQHHGIDYRSFGRVLVKTLLLQRDASGGGSTITQQLVKILYPRKTYWIFSLLINKMREMILAKRLEYLYSKEEILALYLNTVPFGDNTFGIEAASHRFFSIPAQKLTLDQGAVLIGMLKATYSYNPRKFPDRSKARRNVVFAQMKKYEMISAAEADSLMQLPLKLKYNRITHHSGLAPYFREYLRQKLLEWCRDHSNEKGRPYNLYTDGLKIYTTLDSRLQRYAERSVAKHMAQLQNQFLIHWGKREPWYDQPEVVEEAIRKSTRYQNLLRQGKSHQEILIELKKPVVMNLFTWHVEQEKELSPLDSIKYYLKFLNTGVLAMDPHNGAVRVWVGGIDYQYFQYDHVRESTKRQVGSTFKPFVYAAALENGEKPCTYISADQTTYEGEELWTPSNTEDNYDRKYSMEGALAYSVNTAAVHMLEKTGIDKTIELAREMGITSPLPEVPSLALGTPSISVLEMVTAYSCLVNNGQSVSPYFITRIVSRNQEILEEYRPKAGNQVVSSDNAQLMVHMLKRTINEGTGASMRWKYNIKNDMAGKTGTTQSNADGWFMAMTPNLVIGSWVGADDPRIRFRSTSLGQGASTALPIVAGFFQQVNSDKQLSTISRAQFPELPYRLAGRLNCDLYKSGTNVLEKLFGKKEEDTTRVFGEKKERKKKSFFKRLFGQ